MFITPAYAQGAPGGGDFFLQLLPFLLIFVIIYFLILRPQQKRMKEHREMVANLRRGDMVVTSGGLIGKVAKVVDDGEIMLDLSDEVRVRVVRSTIADVRTKGEPVKEAAKPAERKTPAARKTPASRKTKTAANNDEPND